MASFRRARSANVLVRACRHRLRQATLPPAAEGAIQFAYALRGAGRPRVRRATAGRAAAPGGKSAAAWGSWGRIPGATTGSDSGTSAPRPSAIRRVRHHREPDGGAATALTTRNWSASYAAILERFWVDAEGVPAAIVGDADPRHGLRGGPGMNWVMHVHCPDIWHRSARLGLPATDRDVPYGSTAMASAVSDCSPLRTPTGRWCSRPPATRTGCSPAAATAD
jgi:hypothetical protein